VDFLHHTLLNLIGWNIFWKLIEVIAMLVEFLVLNLQKKHLPQNDSTIGKK